INTKRVLKSFQLEKYQLKYINLGQFKEKLVINLLLNIILPIIGSIISLVLLYLINLEFIKNFIYWLVFEGIIFTGIGLIQHLNISLAPVTAVALTRDGKYLIDSSIEKTIKVWNLQSKKLLFTLKGHTDLVTALAITPDGKYLISGSKDKTLNVWDIENIKLLFTLYGHSDSITDITVTNDGKQVISSSSDRTIKVWDLENRKELFTLRGHTESITTVKATPDNKQIISASADKTLQVWDLESRKVIARFTGESALLCCSVAPDGMTIVAGEQSGRVHFLRLEGMREESKEK
ncbi:WD40 repeat domain-containing protein, partial [Anabaena sp. CCY 9910]|uniref:WD40 repeat domain-containing protein n=1 Tax=Anabaena sp. CCY 9910 TaxID=3103870 RepID=UPI0039E1C4E7